MNDVVINYGENHEENMPVFTYKMVGCALSISSEE